MDPIQLIKQDHRTVKELFRKFESASRTSDKQKLGQEIIEELSIHSAIEEQLIYPLIRERGDQMEDAVLNALEEHHAMKMVLAELDKMDADHERYDAKMHVVQESVEMHIEEEESELLPRLERGLDDEDRNMLAESMLEMKPSAPNHPHPSAPDTPPGAMLAMLSKVRDSTKDMIRMITNTDKAAGHRRVSRRADAAIDKARARRSRSRTARRSRSASSTRNSRKRRKTSSASNKRRGARKTRARRR